MQSRSSAMTAGRSSATMTKPRFMPPKRRSGESDQLGCFNTKSNTPRSEHTDFSESTDEIAPLTEEERKARLEEMRQRLQEKKANQALADREDAKRNEVCIISPAHFRGHTILNPRTANPLEVDQGDAGRQGGA